MSQINGLQALADGRCVHPEELAREIAVRASPLGITIANAAARTQGPEDFGVDARREGGQRRAGAGELCGTFVSEAEEAHARRCR